MVDDGFDNRRDEGGKSRSHLTPLLESFRMDEIQTLEGMITFDRAVYMHTAFDTGMTLDRRIFVDDLQLVPILKNFHLS